jgi:hypothetical protein
MEAHRRVGVGEASVGGFASLILRMQLQRKRLPRHGMAGGLPLLDFKRSLALLRADDVGHWACAGADGLAPVLHSALRLSAGELQNNTP